MCNETIYLKSISLYCLSIELEHSFYTSQVGSIFVLLTDLNPLNEPANNIYPLRQI